MDLIKEYNERYMFFHEITGVAMQVHRKFRGGLLESAYEAALKYLLEKEGYKVERQVMLPIYWDDVQLDQTKTLREIGRPPESMQKALSAMQKALEKLDEATEACGVEDAADSLDF